MDYHDTTTCTTADGMVLVSSSWAHTLFDIGASLSFIPVLFAGMLGLECEPLVSTLSVGYLWAKIVSYYIVVVFVLKI